MKQATMLTDPDSTAAPGTHPAPAVVSPPAITPMAMLQLAIEKGAGVETLERLMALQERYEATRARQAFDDALAAFKANPPTVLKNKKAGFDSKRTGDRTEYAYATLAQVVNVIAPELSKHGLSHRWHTSQDDKGISVTCILAHQLGHSESVTLRAPPDQSGSKNNIQAIGSTVTYLQRYCLLAITGLAAEGTDNDGGSFVGFITTEQKDELVALQQEVGADTGKFLAYLGAPSLDELPADRFKQAKAALEQKRGKK